MENLLITGSPSLEGDRYKTLIPFVLDRLKDKSIDLSKITFLGRNSFGPETLSYEYAESHNIEYHIFENCMSGIKGMIDTADRIVFIADRGDVDRSMTFPSVRNVYDVLQDHHHFDKYVMHMLLKNNGDIYCNKRTITQ
jgi:hypothetical protein